jgi:hypothetical protein
MPTGMELYSRDGTVMFTMTDRLLKIIGTVFVPTGQSGSVNVPEWSNTLNTPGWLIRTTANGVSTYVPTVNVSGTTLSYSPGALRGGGNEAAVFIDYGYY